MNPTRARKRIRDLARPGRWEILPHAIERLIERDASEEDVFQILTRAVHCRAERPNPRTGEERFRLAGDDSRSEPLELIVEIVGLVLVVTLYRGDES